MGDARTAPHNRGDAVSGADDAAAAGAIGAGGGGGLKTPLPPVIGAGGDLAAIQRILAGDQYMTVYKGIRAEAESAAQLAYDLAYGVAGTPPVTNGKAIGHGSAPVPRLLVSPGGVGPERRLLHRH